VDVGAWLRGLGLERYEPAFRENDVDAEVLPELAEADLEKLGVTSLGHRKRLLKAIAALRADAVSSPVPPTTGREAAEEHARGRPAVGAERRQLTVMFVDLVGSTALSTRLDPEEMREVLRAYQNTVTGEIARLDGHVAKLMGDGVLAYFGWPRAHEDDAERAVRAGLAIADAVGRLATPAGAPLAVRVGIATGLVVVGDLVGEGAAQEEAVVGETPNLAARLQEAAAPNAVVVAEGTRRLLGEVFELSPLGRRPLRGFAAPVKAFRIGRERAADSRFEARRSGWLPPMVGRDQELALVLERWHQAAAGEGQAVLLVGEAGIGKSRLVRAALDAVEGEGQEHVTLNYQCSPHHTGTALWPVIQQLRLRVAGFAPGDTEAPPLNRLEALLRQGEEDPAGSVPLVATLLGLEVGDRYGPPPELTPVQRRARTLAALADQFLGLAHRRGPALMVLEDAHWADPTTLELVGQTLDRIAGARVLMLLTSRPDNQPALGGHPLMTRLTLNRLGRGPTAAIVARLTQGRDLPPAVLGEIAARTDGVPLFVEELTKAVLEARALGPGVAVPASLHASLMARLDRVPGAKEVAQTAACIGREFAYPLLAAISAMPEAELRAVLERLAAAELVFARGEPPEASYAFKHALVRDAAHESLLKSRRQELHARTARALEGRFPEMVDATPELLAGHFAEAGLAGRAAHHWLRAAELAIERSANLEAIAHCEQAEVQLRTLPPSPEQAQAELAVQLAKGAAVRAGQGYAAPEAERAFSRACELCDELADRIGLVHALRGLFAVYVTRSEWRDAVQVACRLGAAADGLDDPAALALRGFVEGTTRLYTGKPAEALRCFREGLCHCRDAGRDAHVRLSGRDTAALMLSRSPCTQMLAHSSYALLQLGRFDEARQGIRAALARAREQRHPGTLAFALRAACRFIELSRTDSERVDGAGELCTLSVEHHLPHWAGVGRVLRGQDLLRRGAPAEAEAEIKAGLAAQQAVGSRLNLADYLALLAEARTAMGDLEVALASLDEAIEHTARCGERWYDAELNRARAGILHRLKRDGDAATSLGRAIEIARGQGALLWELRATRDLAQLWRDQGKLGEARDLLVPVYGSFTEGFDTPDLREARTLLEELTLPPPSPRAGGTSTPIALMNYPG